MVTTFTDGPLSSWMLLRELCKMAQTLKISYRIETPRTYRHQELMVLECTQEFKEFLVSRGLEIFKENLNVSQTGLFKLLSTKS